MNFKATIPVALALGACATAAPIEIPGCREGPCIAIGETQYLDGIEVMPLEILEDSRCPIEADCTWEGALRIKAQLTLGHEVISTELTAYQPLTINGGELLLAEVAPDASTQWYDLGPGDYRFRFEFTASD